MTEKVFIFTVATGSQGMYSYYWICPNCIRINYFGETHDLQTTTRCEDADIAEKYPCSTILILKKKFPLLEPCRKEEFPYLKLADDFVNNSGLFPFKGIDYAYSCDLPSDVISVEEMVKIKVDTASLMQQWKERIMQPIPNVPVYFASCPEPRSDECIAAGCVIKCINNCSIDCICECPLHQTPTLHISELKKYCAPECVKINKK